MSDQPQPQPGIRDFQLVLVARYVEGQLVTRLVEPETGDAVREQLQHTLPEVRATTVLIPVTVSIDEVEILNFMTSEINARTAECIFKKMRETN